MSFEERGPVWVQPIVVDRAGSHHATIKCAAVASVLAWLAHRESDPTPWQEWLSGPFTKTVRRASTTQVDRLAADPAAVTVHLGKSRAVAFPPATYTDLARDIARLQVSGTDFPRVPERAERPTADRPVRVYLDQDLTTGKGAAQAAHALFGWARVATAEDLATWHAHPLRVPVHLAPAAVLSAHAARPGAVIIRDAGRTEVAPNTLTAVALPL